MLASSRAIALVSVIEGDEEPLRLLPRLCATQARAVRAELMSLPGPRRAATLARMSVELFRPVAQSAPEGAPSHALATLLGSSPIERRRAAEPAPEWVARAASALEPLGIRSLSRAAAGKDRATVAELSRRVTAEDVELYLRDVRKPTPIHESSRARRIVELADSGRALPAGPRHVGLCRVAWSLGGDLELCCAAGSLLPDEDAALLERLARAAWLLADDRAELEQALIAADLEEPSR